jgi:hypothetical protein
MAEIKDSGTRREFKTGAVRDIAEGKGRCDLLPLDIIAYYCMDGILKHIDDYIHQGNPANLWCAIEEFCAMEGWDYYTMLLEVAKHFEAGAVKYSENNWRLGIPLHCYIDSALRHYFKYRRGDKDEPHDRAFVWNLMCAMWTQEHKPDMIDLPFAKNGESV